MPEAMRKASGPIFFLIAMILATTALGLLSCSKSEKTSETKSPLIGFSLDSLVVSIENFSTPKFTPKVNLRIFNGSLSAKTSFMAACILPSVALSGKIPCSFASSFTLSIVLANLRS